MAPTPFWDPASPRDIAGGYPFSSRPSELEQSRDNLCSVGWPWTQLSLRHSCVRLAALMQERCTLSDKRAAPCLTSNALTLICLPMHDNQCFMPSRRGTPMHQGVRPHRHACSNWDQGRASVLATPEVQNSELLSAFQSSKKLAAPIVTALVA